MKKALMFTIVALFVCSVAFAKQPSAAAEKKLAFNIQMRLQAASMVRQNMLKREQVVLKALAAFKAEVLNIKEPEFNKVFQSMTQVMDAHNALRKSFPKEAAALSFTINKPIKTGYGSVLVLTHFINMEVVVLPEGAQVEFENWRMAMEKDLSDGSNISQAKEVMTLLNQSRQFIGSMKEYNSSFILQSLVSVMDAHNNLRKTNPAAAALVSREINKPIATGFGSHNLVVSNFVRMECIMVYGPLQSDYEAWADAIEDDINK